MRCVIATILVVAALAHGQIPAAARLHAPPPPLPPSLRALSPRAVLTGGLGFALALLSSRGYSPNPYAPPTRPTARWNGLALPTRQITDELYEAFVPAALISASHVASVTVFNSVGQSLALTVTVANSSPALPEPPASLALVAVPGLLGDATITNTLALTLMDRFGAPVQQAQVVFATSDGTLVGVSEQPDASGSITRTLRYQPWPASNITPVVAITASVLAPALYASATLTLTGAFIRHGLFQPFVTRPWTPLAPRPDIHAPCSAHDTAIYAPVTVPADHPVDYYAIEGGALYFPPQARIRILEAPTPLALRLYRVDGRNCNPPPGQAPVVTTTLILSTVVPIVPLAGAPFDINLGSISAFCSYLVEIRNDGPLTNRTYTLVQEVVGEIFSPWGC